MTDNDDLQVRLEAALWHLGVALSSNNIGIELASENAGTNMLTHPQSGMLITLSQLLTMDNDMFERMVTELKLKFTELRQAKGENPDDIGKAKPNAKIAAQFPELASVLGFSLPWSDVEDALQKIREIRAEVPKRDSRRGDPETQRGPS